MHGRDQYPIALAAAVAALAVTALLAACANAPDPAKNSINRALNDGGQVVTGSIAQMNRASVRALGETYPACIAYQLPKTVPALNDTFKQVLADISGALPKDQAGQVTVTVYQAQRKGGINPLAELVALKNTLPAAYKTARMNYEPLPPPEFRARAKCPGKDTVLVVGPETQFYRNELPLATLGAGELPIDSVLFLMLTGPAPSAEGESQLSRRPS